MTHFLAASWQVIYLLLRRQQRVLAALALVLLPHMPVLADDAKVRLLDSGRNAKHLTTEMVREIFFMRLSSWPDRTPIHVFMLPDNHALAYSLCERNFGVYPFQLRSAWDRLVFSGTGVSPTMVETEEEMRARIETTPGSIGYTDKK